MKIYFFSLSYHIVNIKEHSQLYHVFFVSIAHLYIEETFVVTKCDSDGTRQTQ